MTPPSKLISLSAMADGGTAAMLEICRNLREWDRREIFATRWTDSPDDLAQDACRIPGLGWLAFVGDTPVAAIGCVPVHPGLWSPWCFGTDNFGRVGLMLTKWARRGIIPLMFRHGGGRRAEVKSMDGHTDAHRWLEAFGARREATHVGYGKGGETFHTYAMEPAHVL